MQTPSAFHTSPDPAPSPASAPGAASSRTLSPGKRAGNAGLRLVRWIQRHSFAPRWLPEPLRQPLLGYLAATLTQVATAAAMLLLLTLFPSFAFSGVLVTVGVILIALGWGAGPGLFATLVGTFLIYYVVLLPHFSWSLANPPDAIGLALYLVVGMGISLIASQVELARRHLEEKNGLLAEAEARSRLDAQRLRTVLDVLPSAVLIADPEGRLVEINQATKALWNGDISLAANIAEYARYNAWWASTGKPVAPQEWTLARALTSGEALLNDEIEIEALGGQRKTILNSAAPIRDERGIITGGVVSALDISAARQLERKVAERARELETLVETISDGIALLDTQGNVEKSNLAFRTMLGFEQHPGIDVRSMRGRRERAAKLAMRDEQGRPLDEWAWPSARLLQGETLAGVDVLLTTLEGRDLVVELSGAPIRDETGQITGCVEVVRDVTERRSLENRTREALYALVAMGEALAQGSVGPDEAAGAQVEAHATAHRLAELTHRVVECQRVTISLIDPEADTLQPLVASDFSPEQEQDWARRLHGALLVERFGDPALVARLHAGEALRLDLAKLPSSIARTYYGTATILVAPMMIGSRLMGLLSVHHTQAGHEYTGEDVELACAVARLAALVIERERLLGEREEARAAALAEREANEQMDAFLSMVSHELKQPLTVMSMSIQLAQRRLGRLAAAPAAPSLPELVAQIAPIQEELKEMAQQAADYQDGLINDLLDAARIRTGKFAICPDPVNVLSLVRSAVEEQRRLTPERVIQLSPPDVAALPVIADGRRIKQVVTNYLTNALKYSPAACPVEVGVTIEDTPEGAQARVCVRDQGPGLAPDELQRVFERFYRAPGIEVQSGTGIGLGLGLYICRTIIEQHSGQIGVESTPGQGSAFWFTLPLNYPEEGGWRAV